MMTLPMMKFPMNDPYNASQENHQIQVGQAGFFFRKLLETESLELAGKRLDSVLAALSGRSRSVIQNLLRDGFGSVNGQTARSNHILRLGDNICLAMPAAQLPDIAAENIPLDIVYEDDSLLVINKPQGMVVHPTDGHWRHTLVNALLFHCQELSTSAGPLRPGIVHRIDKDTSGLLLVAKNNAAHQCLAEQLKEHTVERAYRAIVHGVLADQSVTIDAPIGRDPLDRRKMAVQHHNARHAVTHVKVIQHYGEFTEIRAVLETGRIHQIRVHLAWMGHPVAGDPFYGPSPSFQNLPGQLLHAERLGFVHPETEQVLRLTVEPPPLYQEVLKQLNSESLTSKIMKLFPLTQ